ncbi:MAG: putative 7-carboxy-7-deazaguanine synthase QueE [Ruminococcus sp.]|nr:putative 7-carboxy-7-deazaguanine synthase QueE [Ruminococcus sp.]
MEHTYRVAEWFVSINGEGTRAGELAVFVRLCGCNLRCSYCDTLWAGDMDAPHTEMTAGEIRSLILETGVRNVTLTGGEPLLHPHVKELLAVLLQDGAFSVEIETNGSVLLGDFTETNYRAIFTLDYKLPGSGMEEHMYLAENLAFLKPQDCIKFVAGSQEDLHRAAELIRMHDLCSRCHVYFSPVFGKIEPADMVEFMKQENLNGVRLQLQLHKFIWDPDKRGV